MNQNIQFIQTARGKFAYRDTQNDGFPVIMLHGWPESSYCWEHTLKYLNPQFRYIRPDTRGIGDSERTLELSAYQKLELAKDMIALLDELKIENFALVGHDWGGIIAQEMALLIPNRIKAFVLMNISLINNLQGSLKAQKLMREHGARAEWYQVFLQQPMLAEAMIPNNEEVWIRYFVRSPIKNQPIPEDSLLEYIRFYSIPNTPATAANYYRAMYADVPHWKTLVGQKYQMPSLYIYGVKDPVIIKEYFDGIENCFEQLEDFVELEAGHFVQEEKPQEVAAAINDFFQKLQLSL